MINNISRNTLNGKFSLYHAVNLYYISQLQDCVSGFKRGEINAATSIKKCRKILKEINDPEFPFFAVQHYRELFSFILYQLPKAPSHEVVETGTYQELPIGNPGGILGVKEIEKRKNQRVRWPFPVMFRRKNKWFPSFWKLVTTKDLGIAGMLFHYKNTLKTGLLIDIKIGSSQTTRTINCIGKIIRTSNRPNDSLSGIAIQFVNIGNSERNMLNKFITNNSGQ
ncbi:MAG: hypothetical protein GY941_06435 [Planctomycetes bacterium]|nr:hypothetical protein [Planctomycetota bacterium]